MRKLALLICLLLMAPSVMAQDLYEFDMTITDTFAADSSDSARRTVIVYSDTVFVGDWGRLMWTYAFTSDTNLANDSIDIVILTATGPVGTFIAMPEPQGTDTIAPGADTVMQTADFATHTAPGDSVLAFIYFKVTKVHTATGTQSQLVAGNSYLTNLKLFLIEKQK